MPRVRKGVGGGVGGKASAVMLPPPAPVAEANVTPVSSQPSKVALEGRKGVVKENVKSQKAAKRVSPSEPEGNAVATKKPRGKFPDRLKWKMTHYSMPATSTPKRDPRSQKVTQYDIEHAFGFDDSAEAAADYSTLLSPIPLATPKETAGNPVWKIHPLSQRNVECTPAAPGPSTKKAPRQIKVTAAAGAGEARRSPRYHKPGKAIVIPILSALRTKPAVQQTSTEAVPPPPPKEKSVVFEEIELPTEIVNQSESPSSAVLPQKAKAASKPEPSVLILEEKEAPPPKKPVRTRGRPGKKVEHVKATEVEEPPKSSRPVRSTRSTKAAVVQEEPEKVTKSVRKSLSVPVKSLRAKRTAPVRSSTRKPKTVVSVAVEDSFAFTEETDDEKTEEPVPVKPAVKRRPRTTKKSTKAETAAVPSTSSKRSAKVPPHLAHKPHLIDIGAHPHPDDNCDTRPSGNSPFSQLLTRYNEDEQEKEPEGELHVDPKKIVRTYGSRKRVTYSEDRDPETEYDFVPKATAEEEEVVLVSAAAASSKGQRSRKKKGTKGKKGGAKDEDLDDEAKKWLEEKNKEFEDILKTKLVIEQSFSD